jgi:pimeloyl-ACP methyl ester carboxylesterase
MNADSRPAVVFLHGLNPAENQLDPVVYLWQHLYQFNAYSIPMFWFRQELLSAKINRIVEFSNSLKNHHPQVSLVGISAGGSLALNCFSMHKDTFVKSVNVGGRLRRGKARGYRSFETRTAPSQAFQDSIIQFEDINEPILSKADRSRIMTISALFGDELVPRDTSQLAGARNLLLPTVEHGLSNILAVTLFAHPLLRFLQT